MLTGLYSELTNTIRGVISDSKTSSAENASKATSAEAGNTIDLSATATAEAGAADDSSPSTATLGFEDPDHVKKGNPLTDDNTSLHGL